MDKSKLEKDIETNYWRQQIIEGLLRAKQYEKDIVKIISTGDDPEKCLIEKYSFSSIQAQSIIDLKRPLNEIDEANLLKEKMNLKNLEKEFKKILLYSSNKKMISLEHLDLLLGEALECIVSAAAEVSALNGINPENCRKRLGRAIGELWGVREEIYRIKPDLKQDFIVEREFDEQRYEDLSKLFEIASAAEEKSEKKRAKELYTQLLKISEFGYFRRCAEAALYRLSRDNKS